MRAARTPSQRYSAQEKGTLELFVRPLRLCASAFCSSRSRRTRVARLVTLLGLVLLMLLGEGGGAVSFAARQPTGQGAAAASPLVQGAEFTLKGSQYQSDRTSVKEAGIEGDLTLPLGSRTATFTSGATRAPIAFTDVAPHWWADTPEHTSVQVEMRTSPDGQAWNDWQLLGEEDIIMPQDTVTQTFASTVSVEQTQRTNRYVQSRITLFAERDGRTPIFHELTYTFIDAGVTPNPPKPEAQLQGSPSDVPKPAMVLRHDWGAPDGESSPKWTPKYRRVTHIVIHHTATSNKDTDWAARVRAIWYYHAKTRGWGDIGYNYLIDPNGVIYEGRAGGDDVEAGHAYPFNTGSMGVGVVGDFMKVAPSAATQAALTDLISWKVNQRGIDPLAVEPITGYTNCGGVITYNRPTIAGHRDYSGTACGKAFNSSTCPGDRLWSMLPQIRGSIIAEQPPLRAVFTDHNTPGNIVPGATAYVNLTVRNAGSLTWTASGPGAVTLGYRWLTPDGKPVKGWQDIRTLLPRDVPFANTITLTARLNAPKLNGKYLLLWDMYRDGQGWFSDDGASRPLRVDVVLGTSPGDKLPPTSSVLPLPIYSNNPEIAVRWAGEDQPGGSGIASYDIQYRIAPSGEWTDWQSATSEAQAVFTGQDGYTYEFRSRARDAAGNLESWPDKAQAYTTVDTRPPPLAVDSPQDGAHVKPGPVAVLGHTEAGAFVTVNDKRAEEASGVFTATVQAEGRDFVIHVSASDAAGNISRAEVTVQAASRFSDVPLDSPAFEAIETLSDRGIVGGYPDGLFRPDAPLTHAQLAKLMTITMKWSLIKPPENRFSDVPTDSPLFPNVETVAARGVMRGYNDGTFRPNAPVQRAEAVQAWVTAAGWKLQKAGSGLFLDVPAGNPALPYLESAQAHGVLAPDAKGNFRPSAPMTRGEMSRLIYRYLQQAERREPDVPLVDGGPE